MNYSELFKRAFQITLKYRVLWIFGFLLALCGGSGGNINFSNFGNSGYNEPFPDYGYRPNFSGEEIALFIAIFAAVFCLILILALIGAVVQVVVRTAIIGLVDRVETNKDPNPVSWKAGWQIGWSGKAWRLFLLNLAIGIPLAFVLLVGLILVALPFLAGIYANDAMIFAGMLASAGLLIMWMLFSMALNLLITPFKELGWRYVVLQDSGPILGLKQSYLLLKSQPKDTIVITLLMVGIAIAWGFAGIFIMLALLIIAFIIAVIPAAIAYLLTQEILAAVLAGSPLFLVVFMLPMWFVTGLYLVFQSAVWTLAFRDLLKLNQPSPAPLLEAESPPSLSPTDIILNDEETNQGPEMPQ